LSSIFRRLSRRTAPAAEYHPSAEPSAAFLYPCLMLHSAYNSPKSWIVNPINKIGAKPRLYRRSDTTSIELFFDLFFVANLSTFTATHEINNLNGMPLVRPRVIQLLRLSSVGILRGIPRSDLVYMASGHLIRHTFCARFGLRKNLQSSSTCSDDRFRIRRNSFYNPCSGRKSLGIPIFELNSGRESNLVGDSIHYHSCIHVPTHESQCEGRCIHSHDVLGHHNMLPRSRLSSSLVLSPLTILDVFRVQPRP
jgi:hypothetical protein